MGTLKFGAPSMPSENEMKENESENEPAWRNKAWETCCAS